MAAISVQDLDEEVAARLKPETVGQLHTTAVTLAEIDYGIARLPYGRRKDGLTATAARVFADFDDVIRRPCRSPIRRNRGQPRQRRAPITTADAQIAAICASRAATLATRNTADFDETGINLFNCQVSKSTARISALVCTPSETLHCEVYGRDPLANRPRGWAGCSVVSSTAERLAHAIKLRKAGHLESAREALVQLREELPADAQVAVQTAWVHDSMGLEEEAVPHYEAAIAGNLSDDDLRGALLGLGSTLRTLGRDEESERIFRRGIERFPDFRPLRVFHAILSYNMGRPHEAVQALVEVLLDSTSDADITRYRRALTGYAEDLDRSWL